MINNSEYNDLFNILNKLNYKIPYSLIKLLSEEECEEILNYIIELRIKNITIQPKCLTNLVDKAKRLSSYV